MRKPHRPKPPFNPATDDFGGYAAIYGDPSQLPGKPERRMPPPFEDDTPEPGPTPPYNPATDGPIVTFEDGSSGPEYPDRPIEPHQPEKPVQPEKPRNKQDEWAELLAAGGHIPEDEWDELIRSKGSRGAY